MTLTLLDTLEDERAPEAFTEVERQMYNEQLADALERALSTISDTERAVLQKRYIEDKTLRAVGEEMDYAYQYVQQIERNGLRSLRCGKAYNIMKDYDYRGEGLKHTGLSYFRRTHTSSVEAAVWRMMGLDRVEA